MHLPSGVEPPTPTSEAADAAAMAMAGPSFALSGVRVTVESTEVRDLVRAQLGLDRSEFEPGNPGGARDSDAPCPSRAFEPGKPAGVCDTDGHYMCAECANANPQALADRYEP